MKRILCALLALLMLTGILGGCASNKKNTTNQKPSTSELDEETKKLFETVVLTLDGEPVTYEKYRYYYNIGLTTYLESNGNKLGEDAAEEIAKTVLNELKTEYAIRKLAKEFGLKPTDENIESVDSYIESQKYYAALEGVSYEETLADNYCTVSVFKEWMIYYYFIENAVYDRLYDKKNTPIDQTDDVIKKHLEKYNATLHILLTTKNYSSEENVKKLGEELQKLLIKASELANGITVETTNENASSKLNEFLTAYTAGKESLSYIGSFSGYADKVIALKDQLTADNSEIAIDYLKVASGALSGTDDAIKAVKTLANYLAADGFDEESKKDIDDAYTKYTAYIEKKKLEYFGISDDEGFDISKASYPTGKEYDVLFALELVKATYAEQKQGKNGSLTALANSLLEDAFSYAVLVFGEDRQDHENGIYFKTDEVNDAFEKAYSVLKEFEISGPVKTDYGYHIINRIPSDFEYYKEMLYIEYAISDYIIAASEEVKVELSDFYSTIKPSTLK